MVKRLFFVAAMMVLWSSAQADHAIDFEAAQTDHAIDPAAGSAIPVPAAESATATPAAERAIATPAAAPAAESATAAPGEEAAEPGYLLPVATREVCTSIQWGFDGVRTDCRSEALPVQQDNPALRGICIISYGRRTCY